MGRVLTQKITPIHKGEGHRKRLKDRFLNNGLQGFHDYEVIELLLSLNTPRKDCKQSAKLLLKRFKTFQSVLEANHESLCEVEGVGPTNSLGIRLIKEVSDRYLESKIISKDVVQNPKNLIEYLNQIIGHRTKEVFVGIFLDAKNRVLTSKILFTGTLTTSAVYPREVIISALQHNAAAIIFAHNHPSGDVEPSKSDIEITRKLFYALKYVGIVLHEHMIIGNEGYYSFAAQGLIAKFNKDFQEQK
ncbi:MAG: DNA repair protein RadC [Desulfobacteraceae bacterium]|nr:DNA repair protein RadC [Desulfobacteraceae bacterium]